MGPLIFFNIKLGILYIIIIFATVRIFTGLFLKNPENLVNFSLFPPWGVHFWGDRVRMFRKHAPPQEKKRSQDWSACEVWLIFSDFFKKSPLFGDWCLPHGEFRESDSWFVNRKSSSIMSQNFSFLAGLEHRKCYQTPTNRERYGSWMAVLVLVQKGFLY